MRTGKCYLCGSSKNITRDHVPPKCFFRPPLPRNLITLPCCEDCHKPLSLEDEAFRLWVAAAKDKSPEGKWIWDNKVLESTLKRSPKLRKNILQYVKMMNMNLAGWEEPLPTFSIPPERADKFLHRITKGLLAHFHPEYDYSKDKFRGFNIIRMIPKHEEIIRSLIEKCAHESIRTGVFEFWHGIAEEGNGGCWVYCFYNCAWLAVFHRGHDFRQYNPALKN